MTPSSRARAWSVFTDSWPLLASAVALTVLGILTMQPWGDASSLAPRQIIWLILGIVAYGVCLLADMHFIRRTSFVVSAYVLALALLGALLVFADPVKGAKAWFTLGVFSFQPADFAKLAFIAFMAKYFSRRHQEIKRVSHIILSGVYAFPLIFLVLIQPDLGTAVIMSVVWFGMILVSGISKKHLAAVVVIGLIAAVGLWFGGLHPYQRARIVNFINPAADIHGSGYNAYQAVVAAGSGELFGKGIGYGTQSKLRFLPEYETDFIFAAYAEEWGFVGVVIALLLYALLLYQLISIARRSATNFDALFTIGVALLFAAHLFIHVGINLGLLPVTGTTIPFMSYGGSHILIEFTALGIVASLARHARSVPLDSAGKEYLD